MATPKHTGPSASEYTLFTIWDLVDATRLKDGERAAQQLAEKALRAIQPEPEGDHHAAVL